MDVGELLKNAPGLLEALQQTGVPADKLSSLGGALGDQLGGSDGFDFTDLLGGLDLDNFMSKVDAGSLAEQIGITPEVATQAIALIGPIIADFSPGNLGSLVGKLFD